MVSLIVAYSKNRVIGRKGDMPWHLPNDLKHFKELTTGKTVVMGSKTFDSIVQRLGHGLPNRRNVVLSRDPNLKAQGAEVTDSVSKALNSKPGEELFVIGGGQVFTLALPYADKIYATEIDAHIEGDVVFPSIDEAEWKQTHTEHHPADEKHNYAYNFVTYERVGK